MGEVYFNKDEHMALIREIQKAGREVLELSGHDLKLKGKVQRYGKYKKHQKEGDNKCTEDAAE